MTSRTFGILAGLALCLLAAGAVAWLVWVRPAERTRDLAAQGTARVYADAREAVGAVSRALADVLRVVLPSRDASFSGPSFRWDSTNICEVSTQRDQWRVSHHYSTTWQGSTKSLELRANAVVKAGFDLNEGVEFTVDEPARLVRVVFPRARILSLDLSPPEAVSLSDGWWNKVGPDDYTAAARGLRGEAERQAAASDITARVETWLQRHAANAAPPGWTVEVTLKDAAPVH